MDLLALFYTNLLPVFLAAGAGYALAATVRVDPRAVSHVAFTVFAPALVYRVVVDNHVSADALFRMMGFTLATLLVLAGLAAAVARLARWQRPLASAVVLTVMLPNAGNLGLSANLIAFGDEGLTHASLFFLTSSVLTYTVGIFVASVGRASLRAALSGLARVPVIWAVVIAFVMSGRGWSLPAAAQTTVGLLADACVPTFLVILGMQLRSAGVRGPWRPLAFASGLRLLGGVALAIVLARVFDLQGAALQAGVLQASMPTAVICIILATEYDIEPGFVTSVVFLTTLLSPFTLTPLLAWLGG